MNAKLRLWVSSAVQSCHTDNGTFKSQAFLQEIHKNHQNIRFSGVGAKWQNGAAESSIGLIVSRARTLMLHASIHWPDSEDATLWPLAVNHATYLYNHTPNETSGVAPIEIFASTVNDGQALRNAHTLGMSCLCT